MSSRGMLSLFLFELSAYEIIYPEPEGGYFCSS